MEKPQSSLKIHAKPFNLFILTIFACRLKLICTFPLQWIKEPSFKMKRRAQYLQLMNRSGIDITNSWHTLTFDCLYNSLFAFTRARSHWVNFFHSRKGSMLIFICKTLMMFLVREIPNLGKQSEISHGILCENAKRYSKLTVKYKWMNRVKLRMTDWMSSRNYSNGANVSIHDSLTYTQTLLKLTHCNRVLIIYYCQWKMAKYIQVNAHKHTHTHMQSWAKAVKANVKQTHHPYKRICFTHFVNVYFIFSHFVSYVSPANGSICGLSPATVVHLPAVL